MCQGVKYNYLHFWKLVFGFLENACVELFFVINTEKTSQFQLVQCEMTYSNFTKTAHTTSKYDI